jgi:hypothetical protein
VANLRAIKIFKGFQCVIITALYTPTQALYTKKVLLKDYSKLISYHAPYRVIARELEETLNFWPTQFNNFIISKIAAKYKSMTA